MRQRADMGREVLRLGKGPDPALLEALSALDRECVGAEGWSAESFRSEAEKDNGIVLYVMDGGRPAALLSGYTALGEASITSVAVAPEHRRMGLARLLMEHFLDILPEDTENVFLEVREHNAPAVALYESFGFEAAGLRKNFYRAPVEHAVVMVKKLWV